MCTHRGGSSDFGTCLLNAPQHVLQVQQPCRTEIFRQLCHIFRQIVAIWDFYVSHIVVCIPVGPAFYLQRNGQGKIICGCWRKYHFYRRIPTCFCGKSQDKCPKEDNLLFSLQSRSFPPGFVHIHMSWVSKQNEENPLIILHMPAAEQTCSAVYKIRRQKVPFFCANRPRKAELGQVVWTFIPWTHIFSESEVMPWVCVCLDRFFEFLPTFWWWKPRK